MADKSHRRVTARIILKAFFGEAHVEVANSIILMKSAHEKKWALVSRFFKRRLERRFGVYVAPTAEIAETVRFKHPVGIVIGEGVHIEDRVVIYQGVTLGGARHGDAVLARQPRVREGATIFAGAKVLGEIEIGAGAIVGANAVVLSDVPPGATVVGIPARVIGVSAD